MLLNMTGSSFFIVTFTVKVESQSQKGKKNVQEFDFPSPQDNPMFSKLLHHTLQNRTKINTFSTHHNCNYVYKKQLFYNCVLGYRFR